LVTRALQKGCFTVADGLARTTRRPLLQHGNENARREERKYTSLGDVALFRRSCAVILLKSLFDPCRFSLYAMGKMAFSRAHYLRVIKLNGKMLIMPVLFPPHVWPEQACRKTKYQPAGKNWDREVKSYRNNVIGTPRKSDRGVYTHNSMPKVD